MVPVTAARGNRVNPAERPPTPDLRAGIPCLIPATFQRFNALPLDEAVDAAFMGTPGNMSRDELTRRMAASREARLV
jgi:hypothetical protein